MYRPKQGKVNRRIGLEGQSDDRQSRLGTILIVLAVVVAGLLFWFYQSQRSGLVELNATDLCPKDRAAKPPAVFVVLIDQTDPIGELARRSVANLVLDQMVKELEAAPDEQSVRHARVEIWTFSDRQADGYKVGDVQLSLSRALALCNPGAPAKWDHLYKNADVVKRQHARFYASVRDILDRSLAFPEAQTSPVIEAIYGIGAKVFSSPEVKDSRKRLIIVSDLMSNTPSLRMLSGAKPNFEAWRRTNAARVTMPTLEGVRVTALMIPGTRPDLQRSAEFANFWVSLFAAASAATAGQDWLRQVQ